VSERAADPASGDSEAEKLQQEDLELALPAASAPVQSYLGSGNDERQYRENENTERNDAHPWRILAADALSIF
jgi:hypothetical protein